MIYTRKNRLEIVLAIKDLLFDRADRVVELAGETSIQVGIRESQLIRSGNVAEDDFDAGVKRPHRG